MQLLKPFSVTNSIMRMMRFLSRFSWFLSPCFWKQAGELQVEAWTTHTHHQNAVSVQLCLLTIITKSRFEHSSIFGDKRASVWMAEADAAFCSTCSPIRNQCSSAPLAIMRMQCRAVAPACVESFNIRPGRVRSINIFGMALSTIHVWCEIVPPVHKHFLPT